MKEQEVNNPKEEAKKILCAVYGSLKKGFGNHERHLGKAKLIGKTLTEPKYTMYSLGGFPGITEEGNTPITIEVYEVTPTEDRAIEGLEGYHGPGSDHNFYNKETIETEFGEASIYVINRNGEDLGEYEGGDWQRG